MIIRFSYTVALCLFSVALAGGAMAATVGAGYSANDYGWQVLEKVLPLWQPQQGMSGPVTVVVRVGTGGEVLHCDTRGSSGNAMADMAACTAVARAALYAPPPNGIPAEVFLSLPPASLATATTGAPTQPDMAGASGENILPIPPPPPVQAPAQGGSQPAVSGNYADVVMSRITPHLMVPADYKGEALVVVTMRVNDQGQVIGAEIMESSNSSPSVDAAVMSAIQKAGTMPPPPSGAPRLILSFTLRGK